MKLDSLSTIDRKTAIGKATKQPKSP